MKSSLVKLWLVSVLSLELVFSVIDGGALDGKEAAKVRKVFNIFTSIPPYGGVAIWRVWCRERLSKDFRHASVHGEPEVWCMEPYSC